LHYFQWLGVDEFIQAEIEEKVEAPGGPALLEIIGECYIQVSFG
jgi:hypothetical protein